MALSPGVVLTRRAQGNPLDASGFLDGEIVIKNELENLRLPRGQALDRGAREVTAMATVFLVGDGARMYPIVDRYEKKRSQPRLSTGR